MRILLVNTNPVISRLISWNTRSDDTIHIDEIDTMEKIPEVYYDVVFIDEKCCDIQQIDNSLQKMNAGKKILFTAQKEIIIEGIDRVILKPFLPSEITMLLESILSGSENTEDILLFEESTTTTKESTNKGRSVLDGKEIEIIKQLLLEEEPETNRSGIDELVEKSNVGFEEKLLETLIEMKPKKIRKLLEGAEISITIKFPKEG